MHKKFPILVVDDNPDSLNVMRLYLSGHNFTSVVFMQNPLQALEHLKNHRVSLLISDYEMPEMNGIQLAKEAMKQKIKSIMMISSDYQNPLLLNFVKKNNIPLVSKPFTIQDIIPFVDNMLNAKQGE
jgi:CheY-like chemotaxis protein